MALPQMQPPQPQGPPAGVPGQGQDPGPGQGRDPNAQPGPPQPPQDPNQAVAQAILSMPAAEAISHVYRVAASAAKAKVQLQAAGTSLDARTYQRVLSQSPEVRYVKELMQARGELDKLAGERRRLNLSAVTARKAGNGKRASTYEMQSVQAEDAMEQVAHGTLMFLMVPQGALDPTQSTQMQQAAQQQPQSQSDSTQSISSQPQQ